MPVSLAVDHGEAEGCCQEAVAAGGEGGIGAADEYVGLGFGFEIWDGFGVGVQEGDGFVSVMVDVPF